MSKNRKTGILIHPTSFPTKWGIGDFGESAYEFIDKASENHVRLWQILPLGPTGYGDSPYAARSTFAGNELLIDLMDLYLSGYLEIEDVMDVDIECERVDYGRSREVKMPLLYKAARTFLAEMDDEEREKWNRFLVEKSAWLDDYALYMALSNYYNDSRWFLSWPKDLKDRVPEALEKARKDFDEQIWVYKALQYFFFSQWERLKAYANKHDIEIIGDIPIFVAPDSVDAWANRALLKIDENGEQEASSGVPPDAFSATGQLWGNPLYRWSEHEKTGFSWWISRIRETLKMVDIIRIDHFRGFEACWEVPRGEETAINGRWVKSPGRKLLDAIKAALGDDLPLIAEDLGVITPEVEALRDDYGLPGMKILQFAFSPDATGALDADNAYLPHNMIECSVAYTGTHDNNTTRGWYEELSDDYKDLVRRYFECGDEEVPRQAIRHLLMSNARWAIVPMQDVLMLGSEARMNVPATCGTSNWSWKMSREMLEGSAWGHISYLTKLYGRRA